MTLLGSQGGGKRERYQMTGCWAGVLAPPYVTRVGDGGTTHGPLKEGRGPPGRRALLPPAARWEGSENAEEAARGGRVDLAIWGLFTNALATTRRRSYDLPRIYDTPYSREL